jgi:glutamate-1-semialdehyde 2,1-aminomutase
MSKSPKVVAIVQARMGSTRFRNKVMKHVLETPLIEILIKRLQQSENIDEIILATSTDKLNDPLVEHVSQMGFNVFRGCENNVLERFYQAAREYKADVVIRITGDCPLIDANLVDGVIENFLNENVDYCSNILPPTYPDGLDTEVFSFKALENAYLNAHEKFDQEHVTTFIRFSGNFSISNVQNEIDLSALRWTVDEPADLEVIKNIFDYFKPSIFFSWKEVVELSQKQPHLFQANATLIRNEGANMNTGQKLWQRAKKVIPGGNMLLSKRAEMFLPEQWPAYFSKAKGCTVWDLDDKAYTDMSIMGIGTNILGYGHPEVDDAVRKTIDAGNMSTFNCPEEVYLAETLVEINPWSDMVRFARSGGEANAIAIRIARAASGKDKVAICGYHGWHDWYLAANLGDEKNLAGHLIPGLQPNGVPSNLRGTIFPFNYNNFEELLEIVNREDIGVIKMEVSRNHGPVDGFLNKVRDLATQRGIVLIFDECTSGFRQTYGGLHKMFDVEPDIAMFGKAMGNGYAITAIVGRRSVMEAAQTSFISSTFWTERIGPTAALKTLEVMKRIKSWETITETGNEIKKKWQQLADLHSLKIDISGLPALCSFSFQSENALAYKTFITQEMLLKGYIAGTSVYVSTEHTQEIVNAFFEALDPVFGQISKCEKGEEDIMQLLKGPVCHSGFKRLN